MRRYKLPRVYEPERRPKKRGWKKALKNPVTIAVRVEADVKRQLEHIAAEERVTLQELVRRILSDYVKIWDAGLVGLLDNCDGEDDTDDVPHYVNERVEEIETELLMRRPGR